MYEVGQKCSIDAKTVYLLWPVSYVHDLPHSGQKSISSQTKLEKFEVEKY